MADRPFDTIEGAVKQVWTWQHANTHSFCSLLITLYRKADAGNRSLLDSAYPYLGTALRLWEDAGNNGEDLFRDFGLVGAEGDK